MQRLLCLFLCLASVPLFAQEPGIDLTPRFDNLDTKSNEILAKLDSLTVSQNRMVTALERLVDKVKPVQAVEVAAPAKVVAKASKTVVQASTSCPNGLCPLQPAKAAKSVASNYRARWHNNDGLSLRDHIIQEHGLDPSLSNAQLYAAHDAWHDANGGAPPSSRTVARSVGSACPNGQCPAQRSVSRSYGPLGIVRWR